MSNLNALQDFLKKKRRNPDLGPVERKEPPDTRDGRDADGPVAEGEGVVPGTLQTPHGTRRGLDG